MNPPDRALILDVDGVVSPVHGHTAWGDDIEAGKVFGPVLISPAMCRRLDELALHPEIECVWLTSWSADMRQAMTLFPGSAWPQIAAQAPDLHGSDAGWWKWSALWGWVSQRPQLRRLVWCDDQLTRRHLPGVESLAAGEASSPTSSSGIGNPRLWGPRAIGQDLRSHGIRSMLIAPAEGVGLTPADLARIERFLRV